MISTEQEAVIATANVGEDAARVVLLVQRRFFDGKLSPAVITFVSQVYGAQGHSRKSVRLHRIATEWAAARGAAR